MQSVNDKQTIESEPPTEFTYRGLVFKIHRLSQDHVLVIKQGNRIVSRMTTLPVTIESVILSRIELIKEQVDKGYGLNIDYDKVLNVVVETLHFEEGKTTAKQDYLALLRTHLADKTIAFMNVFDDYWKKQLNADIEEIKRRILEVENFEEAL